MHPRHPPLHRSDEVEVGGAGQRRVDAALHAHLGRADLARLLGPVGDLVQRQPVRVGVALPLRERAEPAADVADVGEVDVAVDDVGDVVADRVAAHVVGQPDQRVQRRTVGGEQGQREVRVGRFEQRGRVLRGQPQPGPDVLVRSRYGRRRRAGVLACSATSAQSP